MKGIDTSFNARKEILMDQLAAITNEDLTKDELRIELERAKGVVGIVKEINQIDSIQIHAAKLYAEYQHSLSKSNIKALVNNE